MSEKLVLTQENLKVIIEEIICTIQSIANTANEFRGEINDVFDKSDLAFLKRISEMLEVLEYSSSKLIVNFEGVDKLLTSYYKNYNNDMENIELFKEG